MKVAREILCLALGLGAVSTASEAEPLRVCGPGGPFSALKEAAAAVGNAHDDAAVVFSGSESMMSDFVTAFGGQIDGKAVTPLYLRSAAILVRPGNPGHSAGIADLMKPGHKILAVNGSGQGGLWKDVAGRKGDVASVKAFRANIGQFAAISADAKQTWTIDPTYGAWLVWGIRQVANPTIADRIAVEPEYESYRDAGVVVTKRGDAKPEARAFTALLASPDGAKSSQNGAGVCLAQRTSRIRSEVGRW
jgi:accessory colonization factor AcfC